VSDEIRRVRALRLRVPEPGLAQRGRLLLEDALHVADVPAGRGSRMLFLRRLDLGRLHAGESSAAIALRIEARIAELAARAVHAASPQAEAAPAVFFSSPSEPLVTLGVLAATGRAVDAWYWPAVLPALREPRPRSEILRLVLLALAERPEAIAATAQLVRALVEQRAVEMLVAALRSGDGLVLARAIGLTPATTAHTQLVPEEQQPQSIAPRPHLAPTSHAALDAALRAWGPLDTGSLWFAAVLAAAEHPGSIPVARLGRLAAALIDSRRHDVASPPHAAATSPDAHAAEIPLAPLDAGRHRPRALAPAQAPVDSPASELEAAAAPAFTAFGGLLFVVNALARLGLEPWLEAHPAEAEAGLGLRLLRRLALAAGAAPEDPILLALAEPESVGAAPERAMRLWARAARRWVKRHAGMGLVTLVERGARVEASATHLDLFFDPAGVDLRVRRCGLDLDPGWVAWLGRVVKFHYGSADG
jgi:hypothetical protein